MKIIYMSYPFAVLLALATLLVPASLCSHIAEFAAVLWILAGVVGVVVLFRSTIDNESKQSINKNLNTAFLLVAVMFFLTIAGFLGLWICLCIASAEKDRKREKERRRLEASCDL